VPRLLMVGNARSILAGQEGGCTFAIQGWPRSV